MYTKGYGFAAHVLCRKVNSLRQKIEQLLKIKQIVFDNQRLYYFCWNEKKNLFRRKFLQDINWLHLFLFGYEDILKTLRAETYYSR